jgi:3-oxoacyl-[acyl-carrier protein] reductase
MTCLENKLLVISGSSRGIGAATARRASQQGARVILHGKNESPQLEQLSVELGRPHIICDIVDETAVRDSMRWVIDNEGTPDALVNCAGISKPRPFLDTTDEHWLETFRANVLGTVHFCKAVIPHMLRAGAGRIVNVASIRGHRETPGGATYSTSKASIVTLTAVLAKEFAPAIAVNAVSPGFTRTDFSRNWNESTWARSKRALLNRCAEPEDIADAILFLASDDARFITGQTVTVDGGYTLAER